MSGKGFAFLPKITVKKELRKNLLKEIPIDDIDMSFKYYFAQRNDYVLQMHEQIFKSFITSKKRCFLTLINYLENALLYSDDPIIPPKVIATRKIHPDNEKLLIPEYNAPTLHPLATLAP